MRPAIVSGIVAVDALFSYWPVFFPVPASNSPRSENEEMIVAVNAIYAIA